MPRPALLPTRQTFSHHTYTCKVTCPHVSRPCTSRLSYDTPPGGFLISLPSSFSIWQRASWLMWMVFQYSNIPYMLFSLFLANKLSTPGSLKCHKHTYSISFRGDGNVSKVDRSGARTTW